MTGQIVVTDVAVQEGMRAARAMGAPVTGSVVGGILNAALPALAIYSPEVALCSVSAGMKLDAWCPCGHQVAAHVKTSTGYECSACEGVIPAVLDSVVSPTDYELWRDACRLAVAERPDLESCSDGDLLTRAKWWRRQMQRTAADLDTIGSAD